MRLTNLPYPGSKTSIAEELVSRMPNARDFIDVFGGRGNVLFAVDNLAPEKYRHYYLNDINTAPLFYALRALKGEVRIPENTWAAYHEHWNYKKLHGYLTAEGAILEPYLCSHAGTYGKGGPVTKPLKPETYRTKLRQCYDIMERTQVVVSSMDWHELYLDRLGPDSFVYLDPPYLDCSVRSYDTEGVDHAGMVEMLLHAKFKWMLSEYSNELYRRAFGKPVEIPRRNGSSVPRTPIGSSACGRTIRTSPKNPPASPSPRCII